MINIKEDSFIQEIIFKKQRKLRGRPFIFDYNEEYQSLAPYDNDGYYLTRDEIITLINGLNNLLELDFDKEFELENIKMHEMNNKVYEDLNNTNKTRKKKCGYIYFIKDNTDLVKIGLTINLEKRFSSIKTSNTSVELIHFIKSNNIELTETLFHKLFKNQRIYEDREWFSLTDSHIKYIKSGNYTLEIMKSINGV